MSQPARFVFTLLILGGLLSTPRWSQADEPQNRNDEKAAKAREKALEQIEKRLGRKEDGTFVVALMERAYHPAKLGGGRLVPLVTYEVIAAPDRRQAAERIAAFYESTQERWRNAPRDTVGWRENNKRPPDIDWRLIGRFEDPVQADQAQSSAQHKLNLTAGRENEAARRKAGVDDGRQRRGPL